MELSVTGQTVVFLTACIFGMALGLLYDIFRVFRLIVPCGKIAVFFQDLLFFLICAVSTSVFMLVENSGELRFFVLLGEFLGAVFYYFTIGYIVIKSAGAIIKFVKMVILFIARLIYRPIYFIAVKIAGVLKILVIKVIILLKNQSVSVKTHLHVNKNMVYNLRGRKNVAVHKQRKVKKRPGKRYGKEKNS